MYPKVIKNYLTQEESESLIELLDPMTGPSPREGIAIALGWPNSSEAMKAGISAPPIMNLQRHQESEKTELLARIFRDVKATFESEFSCEVGLTQANYQNMTKGGKNDLHSDTTNLDGSPLQPDGTPEEMEFSGLLYLNNCDEDYVGGNVLFPNQGLDLRPKTGDLIIFPGDVEHIHEVPEVVSGERKNLVFFYGRAENVGSEKSFYDWQDKSPEEQEQIRINATGQNK
jgi:predicted 2-oxoglutarate/Fe(II)-dependent dioxygenase YbiX